MSTLEQDIIAGLKSGDERAFADVYNMHYKPLCFFACKIAGDIEEGRDIVAEVFIKTWHRRTQFDTLPALKSFLYIATKNACLNHLKSVKRATASQKDYAYWVDDRYEEMRGLMYDAELAQLLNAEIASLPPKCQEIFKLAYFDGLSSEAIAAQLGLSLQTVWNQKTKAGKLIKMNFLKKNFISLVSACCIYLL